MQILKGWEHQDLGKLENPSIASHLSFLQIIVPISPFYPVSQNIYGSCNHSYTLVILIFKNRINQNKVFNNFTKPTSTNIRRLSACIQTKGNDLEKWHLGICMIKSVARHTTLICSTFWRRSCLTENEYEAAWFLLNRKKNCYKCLQYSCSFIRFPILIIQSITSTGIR